MYKSPLSGHIICDGQFRPTIPPGEGEAFWSMSTNDKVDYLFNKITNGPASAGWVTERLCYLGLCDEEHYQECKCILMGLYEGYGETADSVKEQLRKIGVNL
jgi:hypothetical protein